MHKKAAQNVMSVIPLDTNTLKFLDLFFVFAHRQMKNNVCDKVQKIAQVCVCESS